MPFPTIHLLVAEEVAHRTGLGLSGRCLLGAIAPDAVHMRKNFTRADKYRSHLRSQDGQESWPEALKLLEGNRRDPFVTGYALHVLTDCLWIGGPWRDFAKNLPGGMPKEEIKKIYYRDMNHIDNWLFRQAGSRRLWDALMKAPPTAFPQYVTLGEVSAWRRDRYLHLIDAQRSQPAGYITLDIARRFITEAGQSLSGPVTDALAARRNAPIPIPPPEGAIQDEP